MKDMFLLFEFVYFEEETNLRKVVRRHRRNQQCYLLFENLKQ